MKVLEELNTKQVGPKLEVVLFDSALEHLSRLHRVLRMRRGHSVLVGNPGSGRKSLFSLAASAAQCQPFRLPFSASRVPDVVREMYEYIGLHKKSAALYVIDADLKQEGETRFLLCAQHINSGFFRRRFRDFVSHDDDWVGAWNFQ
jgi:dynein heavy chain, axonemal